MILRLLLVLTIIVSAGSAWFAHLSKVRGVSVTDEKERAETEAKNTKVQLTKVKTEKTQIEEKSKKLEKEGIEQRDQAELAKAKLAKVEEEASKLLASFKEKEAEVSKLKEEMTKPKPEDNRPSLAETEAKIAGLRAEVEKAQQAAQEQQKIAETMTKKVEEMVKKREVDAQKAVMAKKDMIKNTVGQIVAYNEGWNFVVINLGDKQGINPDSQLEVVRDGKPIAKLHITQVQPTQTTAGIVADSTSKGVKIKSGDSVMFVQTMPINGVSSALDTARVP